MAMYEDTATPGPQEPHRYPISVGGNYRKWGEQKGWLYNPYTDHYDPDPNAIAQLQESQGIGPPKPPGMMGALGPIAGAAMAGGIGQALGKNPGEFVSGLTGGVKGAWNGLTGLFGAGEAAAAPAAASASAPGLMGATNVAGYQLPTQLGISGPTVAGSASSALTPASASPGMFGIGALPTAGIAAGLALGGKGVYDLVTGDKTKGAADWASRATLGIATGGISEIIRATGLFGSKETWKREGKKLRGLQKDGVYIPQNLIDEIPKHSRSKDQLIRKDLAPDFVGKDSNGAWVNNKFAQSRNVDDLTPIDIVNYSAFVENDPDWFRKPEEERIAVAKQALDAGAVSEGHGQISVDWEKLNAPKQQPQQQAAPQAQVPVQAPQQMPQAPAGVKPMVVTAPLPAPVKKQQNRFSYEARRGRN